MKVLIACEESQIVCKAFRKLGHEAFSCDIQSCSGGHPEWHIQGDVLDIIGNGDKRIVLQSGDEIDVQSWDLMIAHPPCTYIARAGTRWLYPKHKLNQERYLKGLAAKEFMLKLLNADIPLIAVENPVPHKVFNLPKETQVIQPSYFGHDVQKTTYLWLKGLPKLQSTNSLLKCISPKFVRDSKGIRHSKWFMDCGFNAGKEKSKTFLGVAEAMATQWSNKLEVKADGTTTDGIPSKTKVLGILPNELC